jgi:hypothetical protein
VVRSRPIRQILDEMIFVYECSAHHRNMGIPKGISTPARPGTVQRGPRFRKEFSEKA